MSTYKGKGMDSRNRGILAKGGEYFKGHLCGRNYL